MPPTTLAPPHWVVRDLADDLAMTACHEMGHALGALVADLPLQCAWVRYVHTPSRNSDWSIVGRAELVPDGDDGLTSAGAEQGVVMVMAGLEAEAHWMAERKGGGVGYRRNQVWARRVHQAGDIAQLEDYLQDASRGKTYFLYRVAELIDEHWRALVAAAAELHRVRELSGDEIDRLLPNLPSWRLGD